MAFEDLNLEWDDSPRQRRHRHRRSTRRAEQREAAKAARRGGRPKGRAGRSLVALTLVILVLGGLGGGVWYGLDRIQGFFTVPDYTTAGTGEVSIEVHKGDSSADIAQTLADRGVVKSPKAFIEAAKKDQRSLGIAPGTYKLRLKMRGTDALALMLDPNTRVTNTVTVVEGKIAREIFKLLSEKTKIPIAEFEAAAKDPVALGIPEFWFTRDDGKPVNKSIEGFLFPATYELRPNATATDLLKMMVQKFLEVAQKLDFVNKAQNERKISPYQVLVTASIAEVEAPVAADRAKVARVIYNRVYNPKFVPHFLGLDSAVNYWFKSQGKDPKASQDLYESELHNPNNPYNTYDVEGFPVGPISNPGEGAMLAAVQPDPDTSIFYFVTIDKQGNTAFAKTNEEHERNKVIARKNGAL